MKNAIISLFLFSALGCGASEPPHWWSPVWVLDGQATVGDRDGMLVTRKGIQTAPVWVGRCGRLRSAPIVDGAVLQVYGVSPELFPKAPAVQAAVVERAGWRLGEIMGPQEGIAVGGQKASSPAEHKGIFVRSTRKTRRKGPPWMVVVGQRAGTVGVALTDKLATETYASAVFEVPVAETLRIRTLPVWDLNGDGQQELVIYADGADGSGVRMVLGVDLSGQGAISLDKMVTSGPIDCAD